LQQNAKALCVYVSEYNAKLYKYLIISHEFIKNNMTLTIYY
jgi:hypothetical protein